MFGNARYRYSLEGIVTPDNAILSKPEVLVNSCYLSCSMEIFAFKYKGLSEGIIRRIVCILRGLLGQYFESLFFINQCADTAIMKC